MIAVGHASRVLLVRFAGDSGDGVQVVGRQFTQETAIAGNDLATFPDFPAEIRAPAGTLFGVSAYQIHFGARDIRTSGDALDILVAFNPAALKTNLDDLLPGGVLIVDSGTFSEKNLSKANYIEPRSFAVQELLGAGPGSVANQSQP